MESRRKALLLAWAILLAGCGTPAAKDFGGRWIPVNRFQPSTSEIPLDRPYTYYASPMDETLRNMLTRWAADTGVTLVYRLPSDYMLFAPVGRLRTTDIRQAASQLSSIYAAQAVSVTVDGEKLQVARNNTLGSRIGPVPRTSHPEGQGDMAPASASSAAATGVR
jgi:hypothetical protein